VLRNARIYGPLPLVLVIALGLGTGCEQRGKPQHYETLTGRVLGRQTDTGELSVSVPRRIPGKPAEQTVFCVVTKDSEIYVNDMLRSMEAIDVNDAIELVGYYDSDPRQERFVVSFAYIDRRELPPPLPDLPPPPTQPTTQPEEE
jgi:hypothetical protein